jgi:hypothetical protein
LIVRRESKRELRERDSMICRSCGNQERASEGYPCEACGTFICIICTFRGISVCRKCTEEGADVAPVHLPVPRIDWPEH